MSKAFTAICVILSCLAAVPDRPNQPPDNSPKAIKLPLKTNWGDIDQTNFKFIISGHPDWWGEGEIRKDNQTVAVNWINVSQNGRPAYGAYIVIEGKLHGKWGWVEQVEEKVHGVLEGQVNNKTIEGVP